jgi:hypothetical protein
MAPTLAQGSTSCGAGPGKQGLALRLSKDLIHWSDRRDIYGCLDAREFGVHYATFVRHDSSTNDVIDFDDFYLVGTAPKNARYV